MTRKQKNRNAARKPGPSHVPNQSLGAGFLDRAHDLLVKPASEKSRHGRIAGSLLGLSSAAIVSIYTLGYMHTGSAGADFTAGIPQTTTPSAQAAAPASRSQSSATVTPATPTARPSSAPAATGLASYKDGTYSGTGNSRHGGMQVSVVIQAGKIVSAAVVRCGTRYSCAYVDPLARLVVDKQSVPNVHVSGATDSSTAYRTAVRNALAQAVLA